MNGSGELTRYVRAAAGLTRKNIEQLGGFGD